MPKKKLSRYTGNSFILANWVHKGTLPDCPACSLPVVRIVLTGVSKIYVHADAVICEVRG